jgi:hypothetical protein
VRDGAENWLVVPLGAVAQLGERGLCKPEVVGSIPISSTILELGSRVMSTEMRRPARSMAAEDVPREVSAGREWVSFFILRVFDGLRIVVAASVLRETFAFRLLYDNLGKFLRL